MNLQKKHDKHGSFLFQDCKKVSISILFQKFYLAWKTSPIIINRWGLEEECHGWKKSKNN